MSEYEIDDIIRQIDSSVKALELLSRCGGSYRAQVRALHNAGKKEAALELANTAAENEKDLRNEERTLAATLDLLRGRIIGNK